MKEFIEDCVRSDPDDRVHFSDDDEFPLFSCVQQIIYEHMDLTEEEFESVRAYEQFIYDSERFLENEEENVDSLH